MAWVQSGLSGKRVVVDVLEAQWGSELASTFKVVDSAVRFVVVRGSVSAKTVKWYGINDRRRIGRRCILKLLTRLRNIERCWSLIFPFKKSRVAKYSNRAPNNRERASA